MIPDEEKNVIRILNFSAKIKAGLKNIVLAKEKYLLLIYIVAKLSKIDSSTSENANCFAFSNFSTQQVVVVVKWKKILQRST